MGNSITDYRAAIGLFNVRRGICNSYSIPEYETYLNILLTNIRCTFLVVQMSVLQSLNPNTNIAFFLLILHFILLIGNVEQNPGPNNNNSNASSDAIDTSISICNLNIRSI